MTLSKNLVTRYILGAVFVAFSACFQAMATKANIGVTGVWDAVSLNVYDICGLKVGTFSILANICTLLLQAIILGREFKVVKFLFIPVTLGYGLITNLVLYGLFDFELKSYAVKLVFCVIGYFASAVFLGVATAVGTIQMPLENTCYEVSKKYGWSFAALRSFPEFACMAVSVIMSLLLGLTFKIREGTVISMLIFGPVMSWSMIWGRKLLGKYAGK